MMLCRTLTLLFLLAGISDAAFLEERNRRLAAVVQSTASGLVARLENVNNQKVIELLSGEKKTGLNMPLLGFGTCCRATSRGPPIIQSVESYIRNGGRLIDTAIVYGNHKDVATAIKNGIRDNNLKREDLWITTKIAPNEKDTVESTKQAVENSLKELGLDYVDLFLIHAPAKSEQVRTDMWKGLIEMRNTGKIKAIGVSNFNAKHIEALKEATGEMPSVNQIVYHPWMGKQQHELVKWCKDHSVAVTAFGSVGTNYHKGLKDAAVVKASQAHGKTPAQVLLRWALAQGVAVIPGATSESHIKENLGALDFDLASEESRTEAFVSK